MFWMMTALASSWTVTDGALTVSNEETATCNLYFHKPQPRGKLHAQWGESLSEGKTQRAQRGWIGGRRSGRKGYCNLFLRELNPQQVSVTLKVNDKCFMDNCRRTAATIALSKSEAIKMGQAIQTGTDPKRKQAKRR